MRVKHKHVLFARMAPRATSRRALSAHSFHNPDHLSVRVARPRVRTARPELHAHLHQALGFGRRVFARRPGGATKIPAAPLQTAVGAFAFPARWHRPGGRGCGVHTACGGDSGWAAGCAEAPQHQAGRPVHAGEGRCGVLCSLPHRRGLRSTVGVLTGFQP